MVFKNVVMKRAIVLIVCVLSIQQGFSQTVGEWLQQKSTQLAYLAQQIAGLQIYIELAQKGYGIYQDGLDLIGDIKEGEFSLHQDYFGSLSSVKGRIKNSGAVEDILKWRENITRMRASLLRKELGGKREGVRRALEHLEGLADDAMDQLEGLTTSGHYQLTDEERMVQITQVHRDMYGYYAFSKAFTQQVIATIVMRSKERNDVRVLQSLHRLN